MPIPFVVKSAKGLSLRNINKAEGFSKFMHEFMMRKASHIWAIAGKHVLGKKVLDVGMGSGGNSFFLNRKGFDVTSVDVADLSIYEDLKPVIYDGHKLPFKDNQFDTAVIVHVLHHCSDGLEVLNEAKRVAKRVVLVEDTFRNKFEWFWVATFDSITNGELWWHKYRMVSEWKTIIKKNGWKVKAFSEWSEAWVTSPYGRYCMFVLE
jgi:ubiquinone/menaquinone biosynthesis C-methylase UbiE